MASNPPKTEPKLCIINQDNERWIFDSIAWDINDVNGVGTVDGYTNGSPVQTRLLSIGDITSKRQLSSIFNEQYTVCDVNPSSSVKECREMKFGSKKDGCRLVRF